VQRENSAPLAWARLDFGAPVMTSVACSSTATPVAVTRENRFLFDVQGFLHLKGALNENDRLEMLAELTRLEQMEHDDSRYLNPGPGGRPAHRNKSVSSGQVRLDGLLRMSAAFDRCIDYPAVFPYLCDFIRGPQLINSWSISKERGCAAGGWHCGLGTEDYTVRHGRISTRMINTIFFLTDNGPDDGCVAVVPGSHKASFDYPYGTLPGLDQPGSIAVPGKAGDILIFTEALQHTGLANTSGRRRSNLYFNHISSNFREASANSVEFSYTFAMPPHVRARFTPAQKQATSWMEFVKTID